MLPLTDQTSVIFGSLFGICLMQLIFIASKWGKKWKTSKKLLKTIFLLVYVVQSTLSLVEIYNTQLLLEINPRYTFQLLPVKINWSPGGCHFILRPI